MAFLPANLRNYDPEDSDHNSISNGSLTLHKKLTSSPKKPTVTSKRHSSPDTIAIESSTVRSPVPPKRKKQTNTASPAENITPRVQSYPPQATAGDVTPPLAMGDLIEPVYSPQMPARSPALRLNVGKEAGSEDSELSISERRLVMMAIQETVDWNAVAMESGVDADKVRKWWLKASTDLVRRG